MNTGSTSSRLPAVAIIANSIPPYRLHLHRRIVAELPQIRLFSLFTHEHGAAGWQLKAPAEINPVNFGKGESVLSLNQSHEWAKAGKIIKWMQSNQVQAVVVPGYADVGRMRILRWCRRHHVPVFLQTDSNIRDDTATGMRAWLKHRIVAQAVRWANAVMPFGSLGRDYLLKYGARPEEIFLLPFEPDYQLIQEMPPHAIEKAAQTFKLDRSRRRIVYSGRLAMDKRVDLLIDAFVALAAERPEWDLLIIGDGPLRAELESRVPAHLKSRVYWMGFVDDQALISALYRLSDVLVLPSDREPWALVINEAAAAGLAIVTSDVVGAAPELVRDGVNGRIFRHGDSEHLKQCLLETTRSETVDAMKRASNDVLRDWRAAADPIDGLRQALRHFGVIPPTDERAPVAIIANSPTPYRLHLHRRIVKEVPQIRLCSLFTHDASNAPWTLDDDQQIGSVRFGPGEPSNEQGSARNALHEWSKGGRVNRWIRREHVRAVVMLGYSDLGRARTIRFCDRHCIPVFLWGDSNIHGDTVRGMRAIVKRLLVSQVIRRCAGVMPCGSLGTRYFQKYGASLAKTFLMPYEPDYDLIRQIDSQVIDDACRRFNLPRHRRRIVYSGRLIPHKRVDLLVEVFANIALRRPEWDLVMIGGGELMQSLQSRLPAELGKRVTWTGFVNDEQTVAALYRASDVLVLPSDHEPWGVVISEAAAAGLAIVASHVVGAAVELVRDGVNGRIFQAGDLGQLTECLMNVTDSARTDAMKAASAQVLHDWQIKADPVEGVREALRSVGVIK